LVREGEGRGLCVIARDVTAERENEARFGKLLDSLSSGIYSASEEGRFEYANPALTRLLGFQSAEDIFGHSLAEFGLDAGAAQDKPAAVNTTKVEFVNEITVRRRDGFKVTCLHVPGENRDPGGKVCGRYGIVIDLPGRLDSGKRSQREQQFAHRLIESFPDVVLTLDREARYTFVSNRARQVIGLAPAELIGRAFIEQIDIQDRKDVRALIESILSGRIAAGGVEYRIERDGDVRLVRASASPLLRADGKIEGMIASIRDITDSKRNEQQLILETYMNALGMLAA